MNKVYHTPGENPGGHEPGLRDPSAAEARKEAAGKDGRGQEERKTVWFYQSPGRHISSYSMTWMWIALAVLVVFILLWMLL